MIATWSKNGASGLKPQCLASVIESLSENKVVFLASIEASKNISQQDIHVYITLLDCNSQMILGLKGVVLQSNVLLSGTSKKLSHMNIINLVLLSVASKYK